MALTYGFFNSKEGDRRYNAKQFSSIFDGVIEDGVYMKIGGRLMVKASGNGFQVNVQTGRAWFNHTWTLNDAIYAVQLPQPEVLLNKYVAVCLEVDERNAARRNSIVTVSGTPATNPTYPTLTNTDLIHQHPLAYCLVKAGATAITQAEIVNAVGTSACPFVTGAVQNMNIDDLVARWESQFTQWYNANNTQFVNFMTNSRNTFNSFMTNAESTYNTWWSNFTTGATDTFTAFMTNANNEYGDFMFASNAAWNEFMTRVDAAFDDFVADGDARIDAMLSELGTDFSEFWANFQATMNTYLSNAQSTINTWFEHMQGQISSDAAVHLQQQIDAIKFFYVDQNRLVLPNTAASISGSRLILSTP